MVTERLGRAPREKQLELPFGICSQRMLSKETVINHLREDAFDHINEDSAYWIGLLMADGCVWKHKTTHQACISLGLKYSDFNHVCAFRDFLGSRNKVVTSIKHGKYRTARISVRSDRLATSLAGYGVVPRKSYTAKVIGLESDRHFWRGVIDGDGHLGFHKRPTVKLCGSRAICEQFLAYVLSFEPTCHCNVAPQSNVFQLQIYGNCALSVIEHLYANCGVALARKHLVSNKLLSDGYHPSRKDWRGLTLAELDEAYAIHHTWKNVAESLGASVSSLETVRRRLIRHLSSLHSSRF